MKQATIEEDSVGFSVSNAIGIGQYVPETTIWSTIVAGIVTALAPVIPLPFRSPLLVLALIVWLISMVSLAPVAIHRIWRLWKGSLGSRTAIVIGTGGILVACIALVELVIVRAWLGNVTLTWNVDYRWALNHAQAIARTGGVDEALDFAGKPVDYHVASAWFAGAFARVFGIGMRGMSGMLFGVLPLLCVLSAALAIFCLLRNLDLPDSYALLAAGVTLCAPAVDVMSLHPGGLLNPENWLFSSHLMYNSLMAFAVGLCSTVLLLRRDSGVLPLIMGAAGLASVMEIKPQFFIGFGLFIGALALWRLRDTQQPLSRRAALLSAACLSLLFAAWMRGVLPGKENVFMTPRLGHPIVGRRTAVFELLEPWGVLLIGGLALAFFRDRKPWTRLSLNGGPALIVGTAGVGMAALFAVFVTLGFPIRPEIIEHANAVGLADNMRQELFNLLQVFLPLRLLLTAGACATVTWLLMPSSRAIRMALLVCFSAIVLSPLPYIAYDFAHPDKGYEAVDDPDLYDVLRHLERGSELVISSDIADPAEDYARTLRAIDLTAYGGHRFYVADISYMHWVRPEAAERLDNLQSFFQAKWSDWHAYWLRTTGVTHVLLHDRCVPSWYEDALVPLRPVYQRGTWQLFRVDSLPELKSQPIRPVAPPIKQKYGRAGCLDAELLPKKR